ncbi:hypothetical protein [Acidipropionibacterium virtanenii]|uniref:Uncharacterized protein n=1 Tax=Acidipropionibacterium virtanenii TaxID=2057246 RepID=A0A344USU0_9ACTN|nr:hypothetical protein [Acidipropionibacterium virtanenii]AXE38338.1 hypothetical protein JS278_01158 [Acidipropionibacterium virtanenii]
MGTILRSVSLDAGEAVPVNRTIPTSWVLVLWTVVITVVWCLLHVPLPTFLPTILGAGTLIGVVVLVVRSVVKAPVRPAPAVWQLVSLMSPTALLMATFPLIIGDIVAIGHVRAILAVSVAVPWISAATTMPVYGQLTDVDRDDEPAFFRAFMSILPAVLVWSIIPILAFAAVVGAFLGWRPGLMGLFLIGLTANVLFSHMLIAVQETHRFGTVVLSWICYAGALFLAPHLWYLVPLAGCIPAVVMLRKAWSSVLRPRRGDARAVARDVGYGLLYGSVLWVDKFLFIVLYHGDFNIVLLYVTLIPVVVALAVYFASQYQEFQTVVDGLRLSLKNRPISSLEHDTDVADRRCRAVTSRTIAVAGSTAVGMLLCSPAVGTHPTLLQLALFAAPLWFLGGTLMAFQLTQVTGRRDAAILCAAHLMVSCAAIALLPAAEALAVIVLVEVALIGRGGRTLRSTLSTFGYELFWKKAIAW